MPLPFWTIKTSSQECLWIGVCVPGENVWSHTSTCYIKSSQKWYYTTDGTEPSLTTQMLEKPDGRP